MALGSIGVLMIIVVGMASVFLREMRLSRLQYDSILSSTQAEGVFEYAMLKVRNHRDGFADTMNVSSPDAIIFSWASPRTDKVELSYIIESQSAKKVFSWWLDQYIIIPLFTGKCGDLLDVTSCDPREYFDTQQVKKIISLSTSGNPMNLSWSIVAMSGSENISLSGTGNIDGSETGIMRLRSNTCIDSEWNVKPQSIPMDNGNCPVPYNPISGWEVVDYFYDLIWDTESFLKNTAGSDFEKMETKDPYLLIFSSGPAVDIMLETDYPFTLPEFSVTTEARKWEALQAIRFREDKSRYYDALKFGIYNAE